LLASILGTTLGDFVSDGENFGCGYGLTDFCSVFWLWLLYAQRTKSKCPREVYYWAHHRSGQDASAQTMGDFASGRQRLKPGLLPVSGVRWACLLVTTLASDRA